MKRPTHYRTITYFDAVRRHRSIREAARHLGLAASAVNRQILNFEAEIGMPLFERLSDGMSLTPAGEVIARHVIAVLQDERRAYDDLDALRGLKRGEITVIAAESLNASFLPAVIASMNARYPGLYIRVRTAGSNTIPDALIAGDADIGIAFSMLHHRELQQLVVARFRLGAVMRPDHPLIPEIQSGQISFQTCTKYPLILPHRDLSIRSLLDVPLRRFDGRMQIIAEVSSLELMKDLTTRLNAVSFQSRVGLEAELAAGTLVHVPLFRPGPVLTELGVYLRNGRALSAALDMFITLVREALTEAEALDTQTIEG